MEKYVDNETNRIRLETNKKMISFITKWVLVPRGGLVQSRVIRFEKEMIVNRHAANMGRLREEFRKDELKRIFGLIVD